MPISEIQVQVVEKGLPRMALLGLWAWVGRGAATVSRIRGVPCDPHEGPGPGAEKDDGMRRTGGSEAEI